MYTQCARERADIDALLEPGDRKLLAVVAALTGGLAVVLDDDQNGRVVADRRFDIDRGLVQGFLADECGHELLGMRLLRANGGSERPTHRALHAEAEERKPRLGHDGGDDAEREVDHEQ